jgi:hypothetical protein
MANAVMVNNNIGSIEMVVNDSCGWDTGDVSGN